MTKTPDDFLADLFGLPPEPAAPPSTPQDAAAAEAALAAAEAELAAEFAAAMDAGVVAGDAPDSRSDLRVMVSWPARLRLPDARVIDLVVRNVSERGVGLLSDEPIPAATVVDFEMDVPHPDEAGASTFVKGVIETTYTVAHGAQVLCGGTWRAPLASPGIVSRWIELLRR